MIKKLHYVWLGSKPLPPNVKECINSWKKYCPDWELCRWDETNFDIMCFRWVREAIRAKKYAFAADFIRLYVLNLYGGGYLDTDVQILRNIEDAIDSSFVSGVEYHGFGSGDLETFVTEEGTNLMTGNIYTRFCLQAGFMYSEPNHPFIKHCLKTLYDFGNRAFINEDGSDNSFVIDLSMMIELKNRYGIIYRDKDQKLDDDIKIWNSTVFATKKSRTKNSYLIHWFDQSWKTDGGIFMKMKIYIKKYLYFIYRKL